MEKRCKIRGSGLKGEELQVKGKEVNVGEGKTDVGSKYREREQDIERMIWMKWKGGKG